MNASAGNKLCQARVDQAAWLAFAGRRRCVSTTLAPLLLSLQVSFRFCGDDGSAFVCDGDNSTEARRRLLAKPKSCSKSEQAACVSNATVRGRRLDHARVCA